MGIPDSILAEISLLISHSPLIKNFSESITYQESGSSTSSGLSLYARKDFSCLPCPMLEKKVHRTGNGLRHI